MWKNKGQKYNLFREYLKKFWIIDIFAANAKFVLFSDVCTLVQNKYIIHCGAIEKKIAKKN